MPQLLARRHREGVMREVPWPQQRNGRRVVIKWIKSMFARKLIPVQNSCSCWCQSCGLDLCVHAAECVDPDPQGLVWYRCKCGIESQWFFDCPVPILISHDGKPWVRNASDGRGPGSEGSRDV
jgi:hypothetical protein